MNSTSTDAILESISDGVFTVDSEWRITSFNRAAEEITGIKRSEAIGSLCSEVFRSSMCETGCALRKTLESGTPIINRTGYIINANGTKVPVSVSTAVLKDSSGNIIGGAETFRDLSEIETLRNELRGRFRIGDMVSYSPSMRPVFELLPALAGSSTTLLIQGETGTGKEVVARTVHNTGPRKSEPFVAVNCGALPDNLLESELFGYKKGAFTGAVSDKPGRFELAGKGTIFLDEIGEISPAIQVKLLRVLQEHSYEPLGGTATLKTEARVIAATNRNLSEMVKDGEFRQDLFYRINVIPLQLPPLRERKEDIPFLIDHFIKRFNHIQNREITGVSKEALAFLGTHSWPGNVRELENIIERAFVLCSGTLIAEEHLPGELKRGESVSPSGDSISSVRSAAEIQSIVDALKRNGYNRTAAARDLGIHKTTLYRKLNRLGIKIEELQ